MTKPTRCATVSRETAETKVNLTLSLDGTGQCDIKSGIAFFDHMLSQLAFHGRLDLALSVAGDTQIDAHHSVEDCGIVFGQALAQALGDKSGITRFAHAYAPLDESLARVVVDISGRASLNYYVTLSRFDIGGMDGDLFREFFQAVANNAALTMHIDLLRGVNAHHQAEAIFKAFGLALAIAVSSRPGKMPSTKGVL